VTDPSRDHYWLRTCYDFASKYSHDPRTQNAAVIVRDGEAVAIAANCVPLGLTPRPERVLPEMKDHYVEHAERAAIYQAASSRVRLDGATMYCPWAACAACARAIISVGIREVVTHAAVFHLRPGWAETIEEAGRMFAEAGITTRSFRGEIGGVKFMFNGDEAQP
jgi:dCMP deaminase